MPKSLTDFEKFYLKLNLEQKQAVDAIDGPVMVIAGPGTGKTQILTLRIANILKQTDTDPESILALTFTESGVVSMRKRLAEIIGSPAYYVTISTFHGFANDIIRNYPEEFPGIIGSASITDVDQIKIMEEVISEAKIKELRPFGDTFYYLRPALNSINKLKREGVSPEKFGAILKKKEGEFEKIPDLIYDKGAHKGKMKGKYQELKKMLEKNKELSVLYADYEKALERNKFYDYNDMIVEVLGVLQKNKNLLLALQEKYQYLLVDEHQDTNNAQNKILELLASFYDNPNLFVVGDEKQAIFRFQGASLENFLYFKNLYSKAKLITLTNNYRSTQTILDAARSLRKESAHLKANAGHMEKQVKLFALNSPDAENYFLIKNIEEKLESGVPPEEIAVLYRDNKDALPIAKLLEKAGIPFVVESDRNILADNDIKKLILIMRAVENYGSAEELLEAMHADFIGIEPLDIYKITEHARSNRVNPYDLIRSKEALETLGVDLADPILRLAAVLSELKRKSKNSGLGEVFEDIVRESGFLNYILSKPDHLDKLDKLSALSDEARKLIENHKDFTLRRFLEYIEMLDKHEVLIKSAGTAFSEKRLRLMTAHKSKGQEFEYVYIVNAFDKHWGNRRRFNNFELPKEVFELDGGAENAGDGNEDERNLFYVAITRAKKEVVLSYSKTGINGREQLPSQFLEELDPNLIEEADARVYEADFEKNRGITYAPSKIIAPDIKNKEFIKELFTKYGLSVTALNNYLECPWRYFYSNLVRIPEAPNKHLIYGNAVHAALKDFFDKFREGEKVGANYLVERFKSSLASQPIEKRDYEEALAKGEKALSGYFETHHSSWPRNILSEFNVKSVELAPDIRLTGKIDKIEILDMAEHVNVADYKTGKPKSRGEIEGLTANSGGEYKRQLVFYKLLLDGYAGGKYKMVSGDIDFIEPDDKGRYRKERFEIKPEETLELKEKILEVSDEILNLKFWDKSCGEKDCKFCGLRNMMA